MSITATQNVNNVNITATQSGISVELQPTIVIGGGGATGDMLKSTYDTDLSGIVDSAEDLVVTAVSNKTLKDTLDGTEEVLINDAGTFKKTTSQAIADLVGGGGGGLSRARLDLTFTAPNTTNYITNIGGTSKGLQDWTANTGVLVGGLASLNYGFLRRTQPLFTSDDNYAIDSLVITASVEAGDIVDYIGLVKCTFNTDGTFSTYNVLLEKQTSAIKGTPTIIEAVDFNSTSLEVNDIVFVLLKANPATGFIPYFIAIDLIYS